MQQFKLVLSITTVSHPSWEAMRAGLSWKRVRSLPLVCLSDDQALSWDTLLTEHEI